MSMAQGQQWDDSALVDSWNEALEEYKARLVLRYENLFQDTANIDQRYHSIHAKGGNISDFQREYPEIDESTSCGGVSVREADKLDSLGNEEAKAIEQQEEANYMADEQRKEAWPTGGNDLPAPEVGGTNQVSATIPIQTALGSVGDENLKRLLMSWYYAGYYLGLYERQQKTKQSKY